MPKTVAESCNLTVTTHSAGQAAQAWPRLEAYLLRRGQQPLSRHPAWLQVLQRALGHTPYLLEVHDRGQTLGHLPLCLVRSFLFGRFLVGLPYLNYGGVLADDERVAGLLIDRAVQLADQLKVKYLELRHEQPLAHSAFTDSRTDKVHMRLALPDSSAALWKQLDAKVRNQVRKGQKSGLKVCWGGIELLPDFYAVFSINMRDLGTPVFGRRLFQAILEQFPNRADLCVVYLSKRPVAAGLLLHGWGITEVPSASSLREYNFTCANMLMYWSLLERALERHQAVFDFGRSSRESNTFRFKQQWGAAPHPAEWQYHTRVGGVTEMRTQNPRYQRFIRIWQRLPVRLTRWIGPPIVRGIP
jgi:FemAB-related protein (PEP-CTERM system-associated)